MAFKPHCCEAQADACSHAVASSLQHSHSCGVAGNSKTTSQSCAQEDLIGQEKEKKGDEARRARLHQQWLEQQDAQQVAQLMQGVRNGFRRKRAGDLLVEDVSPHVNC